MSMKEHFHNECALLGWNDPKGFLHPENGEMDPEAYERQQIIIKDINDVLDVIGEQGRSGHSSPYFFNLLEKAANLKPLTPLTGEDNEWTDIREGLWQNRRCSSVFKNDSGECYDIDGYVFREPWENTFTSLASRRAVTFPWWPQEPVYLDVPEDTDYDMQMALVRKYEEWQTVITRLEAIPLMSRPLLALKDFCTILEADWKNLTQAEYPPNSGVSLMIKEQNS